MTKVAIVDADGRALWRRSCNKKDEGSIARFISDVVEQVRLCRQQVGRHFVLSTDAGAFGLFDSKSLGIDVTRRFVTDKVRKKSWAEEGNK